MKIITLQELCSFLDGQLAKELFRDYCPNGLQVEGKESVATFATAVSASLETIEVAVKRGFDALIVHHGLFWKGDEYSVVGVKKKKLDLLLKSGLSLLAYHLPLDAHTEVGNNWRAAKELGWKNMEGFGLIEGRAIGVYGEFSPIPRQEFEKQLVGYYGRRAESALHGREEVRSACLLSGGGYKFLAEAARRGADCFVTGNFDEPAWHDAKEWGINFFAMGHSATERVGPLALLELLKKELSLRGEFIDIYNPF